MTENVIRAAARSKAARAALMLSSAVSVIGANVAVAQTVSQSGPGNLSYTAPTLSGTPTALSLTSTDGNVEANVQTVTASGGDGNVVALQSGPAGTITANIGSVAVNSTGAVTGIRTTAGTGQTNITAGSLDITGTSGTGILIFSGPGVDQFGDPLLGGGGLNLTVGSIRTTGIEVAGVDGRVGGAVVATVGSITTTGEDASGFSLDTTGGDLTLTAGTLNTNGDAIDVSATDFKATVTTTGNITSTTSQAITARGKDVVITTGVGTTVASHGDAIEADGDTSVIVRNQGTIVSTGGEGDEGQAAIRASATGAITIESLNASSGAVARDYQQDGTIRVQGDVGPVSITAGTTTASGDGMSGIFASTTSGVISVDAKTTSTTGQLSGGYSADTISLFSGTGTITVKSGTVSNDSIYGSAIFVNSGGDVAVTSDIATATKGGGVGIAAFSTNGTSSLTSGTFTGTAITNNPTAGQSPTEFITVGLSANGRLGATLSAGTTAASGNAIVATSAAGNTAVATTGSTSSTRGNAITATGGAVTVATGADVVTSTTGLTNAFAINAVGRNSVVVNNGGTASAVGNVATINAVSTAAVGNTVSVTSKTAINTGTAAAIFAQAAATVTVESGTATATGPNAVAINAISQFGSAVIRSGDATGASTSVDIGVLNARALGNPQVPFPANAAIVSTGSVLNSASGVGIYATARDQVIIDANNVEAGFQAIRAAGGTTANVSIEVNGAITSRNANAISLNSKSFGIDIGDTAVVTANGGTSAIAGGASGGNADVFNRGSIVAQGNAEGGIGVTASGDVTIESNKISVSSDFIPTSTFSKGAISAVSNGGGNVSVQSTTATVHGADRYGITASTTGAGRVGVFSGSLSNDATSRAAISATTASGDILVDSGTLRSAGAGAAGIRGSSTTGNITVKSVDLATTGGLDDDNDLAAEGIFATTGGIVSIASKTAVISGDYASAIAVQAGGPVTVSSEKAQAAGSSDVIYTESTNGDISVTSGKVIKTGATGGGITAQSGGKAAVDSASIEALGGANTAGIFVNAAGDVAIKSGSIASTRYGISAASSGGNVAITTTGDTITGTNTTSTTSFGVRGNGGAVTITTAGTTSGGTGGIEANGRDSTTVVNTGMVKAASGTALLATSTGGGVSITSKDVSATANGAAGIRARTSSGAIEITSTGTVTTAGNVLTTPAGPSYAAGIWASSTTGAITIANTGAIAASGQAAAIRVDGGSGTTITNAAGASLSGAGTGVANGAATLALTNAGTITGTTGPAIVSGGRTTLINSGTITGTATATTPALAAVLSNADDLVELRTGSVVNGLLVGGAGVDSLLLSGSSAAKTDAQTVASTAAFETMTVGSGYWTAKGVPSYYGVATVNQGATLELQTYLQEDAAWSPIQAAQFINNGVMVLASNTGATAYADEDVQIGGSGSLRITGNDTILVSGNNNLIYTGGTSLERGTLQLTGAFGGDLTVASGATFRLGDGGTTGLFTGNLVDNGTFIYDRNDSYTFAGNFSGAGQLTKNGSGTLTFDGQYGFTGTTSVNGGAVKFAGSLAPTTELALTGGTVDLSGVDGGKQTVAELAGSGGTVALGDSALTVNQATNTAFSGNVTGTGGLTKTGTGTLDLTGTSSYTGATNVSGGTLKVNGSIANSTVNVAPGGTLGGNGTVGGINATGGTLSPGNSIGRMTVNGAIVLNASSTYAVEANNLGQADRVDATGTATLGGAKVAVTAASGVYRPATNYTILTAAGGVSGTFGSVTSNLAFLTPSLSYSTNAVTLTLTRNNIAFAAAGRTPNEQAVGGAVQALGVGNQLFDAALTLTDTGVSPAFGSLAGQVNAATATGLIEATQPIRGVLDEVSVGEGSGGFAWGNMLGNFQRFHAANGNERLRSEGAGVLAGLGYGANGFIAGIGGGYTAPGYNGTTGSADTKSALLVGFAGYEQNGVKLKLGGSYAWTDVDSERRAIIGSVNNTLLGETKARTGQVFAQVSYDVPAGAEMVVAPIAGLAYVHTSVDGFTETGGAAALTVGKISRNVTYSTLGLGVSTSGNIRPFANLAWRHGWGDLAGTATVGFAGTTGRFDVTSAGIVKDAADFSGGVTYTKDNFSLSASAGGVVGKDFSNTGVKLTAGFRF